MKQLLNTLFVTSEDIYLSLEGENVLANRDKTVVARYPLHTLQAIVSFSYAWDRSGLLLPARTFPCPHLRREQRQRTAPS